MPGGQEWELDAWGGDEPALTTDETRALRNRRQKQRIELELLDNQDLIDQEISTY
jgi:hypothetical protein